MTNNHPQLLADRKRVSINPNSQTVQVASQKKIRSGTELSSRDACRFSIETAAPAYFDFLPP
ncbi:MAG: hypothetical protein ACREHD_25710, partial [Pirellulales bacterium]